jgi:hypothetical protein
MPWYYAGPDAKPLGPVTAEQLQALCSIGTITPETFIIEHTGPGAANLAWKRYKEIFPTGTALPPLPPTPLPASIFPTPASSAYPTPAYPAAPPAPTPGAVPAPNPSAPNQAVSQTLFPSAASSQPGAPAYPAPVAPAPIGGHPTAYPHAHPPIRHTNSWCAWGFALSLVGFCLACGCIGLFPALLSVVLCIIGLVQVNKNPDQGGRGLAVTGLIFSGVAILIAVLVIAWWSPTIFKAHGLTVTEQTSNDSE